MLAIKVTWTWINSARGGATQNGVDHEDQSIQTPQSQQQNVETSKGRSESAL